VYVHVDRTDHRHVVGRGNGGRELVSPFDAGLWFCQFGHLDRHPLIAKNLDAYLEDAEALADDEDDTV
jgi:hypothetical protein